MDTDLVVRAQNGDEEAFASLAVAVGDRLHAVAHRILRDIDLAEDATQQALLSIWRDFPQLRDPAPARSLSFPDRATSTTPATERGTGVQLYATYFDVPPGAGPAIPGTNPGTCTGF